MSTHDRANELRMLDDLWPEISQCLYVAAEQAKDAARFYEYDLSDYTGPSMRRALEEKFRKGEAEHGRDWLNMSRDQLLEEINAELQDLVLYHAMILARWVDKQPNTTRPFITNRGPGDEVDS